MYKWIKDWRVQILALVLVISTAVINVTWIFLCDNIVLSKGKVWPKPRHVVTHGVIYQVKDRNPDIIATGQTCDLLDKVIARVTKELDIINGNDIPKSEKSENSVKIEQLNVHLTKSCEEYPYLGMNETYELSISTTSELQATSIWGIIRGLETFVQLFYHEDKNIYIRGETIMDYPNYEHRGLMLDTGRLFVPVYDLLKILDGMAMNKLNVFHWHICDNFFCPIKSETFPNMSNFEQNVYTKDDFKLVVNYARERGIRVIPEIDVPGHQAALQKVFPKIFLPCNNIDSYELMNPTLLETYDFLERLLTELSTWFPDNYIHLGGDEAHPECWGHHNEIINYMIENHMSLADLQSMFYQKVVAKLKPEMKQIVWQDVYDYGIDMLTDDIIVQVWNYNPENEMAKLLKSGYQVLYSSFWYLNFEPKQYDFGKYYTQDPRNAIKSLNLISHDLIHNIKGGEACLWTNDIRDYTAVLDWIFPKTCAAAEVLWSLTDGSKITEQGWSRIKEQTLRMTKRGVPTKSPR